MKAYNEHITPSRVGECLIIILQNWQHIAVDFLYNIHSDKMNT